MVYNSSRHWLSISKLRPLHPLYTGILAVQVWTVLGYKKYSHLTDNRQTATTNQGPLFSSVDGVCPHRNMSRTVKDSFVSVEQDEGMGARVRRTIGRPELRSFDPFLMLDEFRVAAPAGFPDHPHRGFETVTYMLSGSFRHEDFCGHKGIIGAGDLQWMTAGRGIVHCEMPYGTEVGHGLQLWVNLAKANKMVEPVYQELLAKDIPTATKDGVTVKVIAGEAFGIKSKVYTRTPTTYLDFKMAKNSHLSQPIPEGWNSFVYVLEGSALFGPEEKQQQGDANQVLTLNQDGKVLEVFNKDQDLCHFVLLAGKPLHEKVVQHGVFVMTSEEEVEQARKDYLRCQNGFENARDWNSFIVYEDDDPSTLLPSL